MILLIDISLKSCLYIDSKKSLTSCPQNRKRLRPTENQLFLLINGTRYANTNNDFRSKQAKNKKYAELKGDCQPQCETTAKALTNKRRCFETLVHRHHRN